MLKRSVLVSVVAIVLAVVASSWAGTRSRTATTAVETKATVKIGNFQFTPKVLTIASGTTVEWINEAGRHLVVADDGSFKSDVLKQGDKFEHKFDKAGTVVYYCEFHGDKGGKDMSGKIVVRGAKK
jgi:plastocyanin